MNSFEKMIHICKAYVREELDIEEFQSRLEMVVLPDNCKNSLEKKQHNAVNMLEEIRFCYLPENQYKHAKVVAEKLINEVREYMNSKS